MLTSDKELRMRIDTIFSLIRMGGSPSASERIMNTVLDRPYETDEGVIFTVMVGFLKRDCLIPKQTLFHLCRNSGSDMDCMHAFRAHEDTISSVARRLVITGAPNSPVILERRFFPR